MDDQQGEDPTPSRRMFGVEVQPGVQRVEVVVTGVRLSLSDWIGVMMLAIPAYIIAGALILAGGAAIAGVVVGGLLGLNLALRDATVPPTEQGQ